MIKNIMSNGTYLTILSFILTTITYFTQAVKTVDKPDGQVLMLFLTGFFLLVLTLDIIVLKRRKFIYITKREIIIATILLTAVIINIIFIPISIYLLIIISWSHYTYRVLNYMKIEDLQLESKYEDIRKVLKLTKEYIAVKGELDNYTTYISGTEISFDTGNSLLYKNRRIKFDIIKQMQIDFNKAFINFDDDELKVAEMYSIQ